MRVKKLVRWVAVLLCAALALAGGAAALSRAVYGRSLRASVYEVVQRVRHARPRTPEEEIARLEARRAAGEKPAALPKGRKLHVEATEAEVCGMQVFALNPGAGSATVLYLHGGAYVSGFNDYQWRFMDRLASRAGCEILAPAYHLAPFGDCERAMDDLTALYTALAWERAGRRLILMGDSAGGGLALALAQALAERGSALPERLILFSPWVDVSMENPEIADYLAAEPILNLELTKLHGRYWAGAAGVRDRRTSPLYGDMAGLPPVTVYCGTRELLYPDIRLACEKLRSAGVETELHVGRGLNHDYPLMPIPEAEKALAEVAADVAGT